MLMGFCSYLVIFVSTCFTSCTSTKRQNTCVIFFYNNKKYFFNFTMNNFYLFYKKLYN